MDLTSHYDRTLLVDREKLASETASTACRLCPVLKSTCKYCVWDSKRCLKSCNYYFETDVKIIDECPARLAQKLMDKNKKHKL